MAYSVNNPPRQVRNTGLYVGNTGSTTRGVGGQYWVYNSTDAKATVAAAGYFTNALSAIGGAAGLGMLVGDVVEVQDTTTPMVSLHRVTAVAASGSTLSAGLNIT